MKKEGELLKEVLSASTEGTMKCGDYIIITSSPSCTHAAQWNPLHWDVHESVLISGVS